MPMGVITAESTISALNIFGRLKIAAVIATNTGRQFVAKEFEILCIEHGIRHLTMRIHASIKWAGRKVRGYVKMNFSKGGQRRTRIGTS